MFLYSKPSIKSIRIILYGIISFHLINKIISSIKYKMYLINQKVGNFNIKINIDKYSKNYKKVYMILVY